MEATATGRAAKSYRERVGNGAGTVDRTIFADRATYELELERIFGRAWLFMCHDTQIPNRGDFFQTYMGEEKVIATRNRDGGVEILFNACMHRGAAVCRAHSGNARSFTCAYHGWTYDLSGKLIGVPGYNELYGKKLDRDALSLRSAAQVASYRGFVFATLDPEAPPLEDFLGEAGRFAIDKLANYGDMEVVPGVIRHRLRSNWKFAVENDQDYYHVGITHASMFDAWGSSRTEVNKQYWEKNEGPAILGEYGHVQDTVVGHYHGTIFPHMSLLTDLLQVVIMRHPRGPDEMEMWYFTFVDKNATAEEKRAVIYRNNMRIGPSGMVEQDDAENWEFCTKGANSTALRDVPFNFQMGLGQGETVHDDELGMAVHKGERTSEECARWRLNCWAEWMDSASWPDLMAHHSALVAS